MCVLLFLDGVFYMSHKPIWSNISCKISVFLLFFCLNDLAIDETEGLMSPPINILLCISPFMSVSIYLLYVDTPVLDACLQMVYPLAGLTLLSLCNEWSSLSLTKNLYLNADFTWYKWSYLFFWFQFAWTVFFPPFAFSLCVSFCLKGVSYRQHIHGFRLIWSLYNFLMKEFSLFTFKIMTDEHLLLFCELFSGYLKNSFVIWWFL